jgi:hypothetical protein
MSYGLSAKILQELLPIEGKISTTTVRNNLHACAQRLESELGEENGAYIEGWLSRTCVGTPSITDSFL